MKVIFALACIILLVVAGSAQSGRVFPSPAKIPSPKATPTPTITVGNTSADKRTEVEDSDDVIVVDTRLVTIPVRVIDRTNRFIGGLTRANFSVFEDGVEQEIAYFSNEAQPFTVALVLDMSYSTRFKISEIQSAAIAFIDQLRPEDKVIVISFDETVHVLTDATGERRQIYRAIRSTRIATGTSLYEAVDVAINERLRSIEGRKAVVLFTDGVDTTSRASNDLRNLHDVMEIDSLIYPIRYDTYADVQALKRGGIRFPGNDPTTIPTTTGGIPDPFPAGLPPIVRPGDKGTTAEEYAFAEEYLNQLAQRSGGRVYFANTLANLSNAFAKIASELREFYSLGYYPPDGERPGLRRIRVRVDRKNAAVKARESYAVVQRPNVK